MKISLNSTFLFDWLPFFYRGRWYSSEGGYGTSYNVRWLGFRLALRLSQDYPPKDYL